jgi:uncharacterized protein YgbK (DUF1537 family)
LQILAFADDMTGALEVGAKFAAHGIEALVHTALSEAPVQVIDTETRHLTASAAADRIRSFTRAGVDLIYKKTDSTLRGNIGSELGALAEAYPDRTIGYAPAYPALGRTLRDGILYVDGVPVHQTTFGRDELNPVQTSAVRELIGAHLPCTIFDGETDTDIDAAAATLFADPRMRIAAGPAAFADALARHAGVPRTLAPSISAVRKCVILNGSRHPASSAQIDFAIAQGCASRAAGAAWRIIERGEHLEPQNIIVFGGDTAYDVVTAWGALPLTPLGEPIPGVAVSRYNDRIFVSKAGGFGAPDLICKLRQLLDGV